MMIMILYCIVFFYYFVEYICMWDIYIWFVLLYSIIVYGIIYVYFILIKGEDDVLMVVLFVIRIMWGFFLILV